MSMKCTEYVLRCHLILESWDIANVNEMYRICTKMTLLESWDIDYVTEMYKICTKIL